MVPVIENEDGELIGVTITMGSLSHAMQKAKGSLFPFGWYHILRSLKWKREEKAELLLIAIRPDYQGLGVNALFFNDLIPIYNKYKRRRVSQCACLGYAIRLKSLDFLKSKNSSGTRTHVFCG